MWMNRLVIRSFLVIKMLIFANNAYIESIRIDCNDHHSLSLWVENIKTKPDDDNDNPIVVFQQE